ncbi:MAG: SIS domain-containing protein [Gemmatimonadaceae bacterium]
MTTAVCEDRVPAVARRAAAERFAATNAAAECFFSTHADAVAQACQAIAAGFQRGGRLFVGGDGAQRSDVAHVVVEFVHPVIVGKRALPALPLPDIATGAAGHALAALGRRGDLLIVLAARALDEPARTVLATARARGILTLALTGPANGSTSPADHLFAVPSDDPGIVQETHEMLYHVLWELVHVFLEHRPVGA